MQKQPLSKEMTAFGNAITTGDQNAIRTAYGVLTPEEKRVALMAITGTILAQGVQDLIGYVVKSVQPKN